MVKCYGNREVKSPYSWVISHLTQPQVANQRKKKDLNFKQGGHFLFACRSSACPHVGSCQLENVMFDMHTQTNGNNGNLPLTRLKNFT